MKAPANFLKFVRYYLKPERRFERIPGFSEFVAVENQKLAVSAVRILCALGAVLYMSVSAVDYLYYPEKFSLFLVIRLVFAIWCITTILLTMTEWGKRNSLSLVFANALFGELIVSFMISQLSGWTSLYFVGNILTTTAITMFIPWRPRVNILYCALSLTGYITLNCLYHPFTLAAIMPIAFIFINGINSYFACLASRASRLNQWASRLEVEKAHEDLKILDEAKARFFSNVSHELRTPLTLLIGPLGALAKRGGGWVSPELVLSMSLNAQRLLRHVNALLDLGKIDSQEMKCNMEVGNIKSLIFDLYRASAPGAAERGIKVEFQVPKEIPNSLFDIEKIETIVANLISNAVKFTPPQGSVILTCNLEVTGVIRIGVRDTGPGIPHDQQEKIFGRFHQVESSAKKVSKGTGLGLSVAKEFAELHGGKIWVESEPGMGTEFFVEIPYVPTDRAVPGTKETELSTRQESRSTLLSDIARGNESAGPTPDLSEQNTRRMRERDKDKAVVLYVDDSPDLRAYVSGILGDSYTLLLAQDGEQGLEQALMHTPDFILSDVMMPKMNGFELCRRIRADAKTRSIPFVLLTANSSLDSKIEGLQDGADDYLSKPFSERELIARIKNMVTLRQQGQMIKQQITAAKKIQQSLIPPLSQALEGVMIEAVYEPSDDLSGDFFDTIACGGWVYIYLADVTGHGLAAAQITYLVKEIFRHALEHEMPLADLFNIVREKYLEHQLDYDLGLQLMRIHSGSGAVEFLRSNAPNPLILNAEGQVEELDMPMSTLISSVMSLSSHKAGEVASFKLERGSTLFCFSDGTYEFKLESGSEFGLRRLMKTIASTRNMVWPEGLVGALRAENRHAFFPDDITILRISI